MQQVGMLMACICIISKIRNNNKYYLASLPGPSQGDLMTIISTLFAKGLNASLNKAKQTMSITMASLLLVSASSFAAPISNFYVFGDSLSDSGAFQGAVLGNGTFCPSAPYAGCRFSNGPVWAELVAQDLGFRADTAYVPGGGTNYAVGGQTTADVLNSQIPNFLLSTAGVADTDALYVILAGGNDFFQNNATGTAPSAIDAVDNIINSIISLRDAGAKKFLVGNVPLLEPWIGEFNAILATKLDGLERAQITQFDAFGTFIGVITNPADFALTNAFQPCVTATSLCTNPDEYLLWDAVHPTAVGHRILADAALAALKVSAPATLAIFSLGFALVVCTRRKIVA
jgi:phospholipase/lecithinase/hemolysin